MQAILPARLLVLVASSCALLVGCAADDAGDPCDTQRDCEAECFSDQILSEAGICTNRCGPDSFDVCSTDWHCVDTGGEDYWCLPECAGFFGDSCSERFGEAWQCETLPLAEGGSETVCID